MLLRGALRATLIFAGIILFSLAVRANEPDGKDRLLDATRPMQEWDSEQLKRVFKEGHFSVSSRENKAEEYLVEMLRRKDKGFIDILEEYCKVTKTFDLNDRKVDCENIEALTALRRMQGEKDPLIISVDVPTQRINANSLTLPSIDVAIKNQDIEKKSVLFKMSGDYRSGRQARWRIIVTDENGKTVEVPFRGGLGGGMFAQIPLHYEKSWATRLRIRDFINVPTPGKYSMIVAYHNHETIANMKARDLANLIYSKSEPIQLTIEKVVIEHTQQDDDDVKKLIEDLDDKLPFKVVAGTYGEWAHKFLKPDSPEAKLITKELRALPTIVSELQQKGISATKRARLFSILFSITGENDPRKKDVLPNHKSIGGGWKVWGKLSTESTPGNVAFTSGEERSIEDCEIDPKEQDELVKSWVDWLKNCDVKTIVSK